MLEFRLPSLGAEMDEGTLLAWKVKPGDAVKKGDVVAVVDTNCSPEGIDYPIPGNDDAMRAIELYAQGIADAVIDGKASIPEVPTGDDEFVELDEEGKPKVEQKAAKKAPAKKRARVTKIRSKGRGRPQPEEGAPEPVAGDVAADGEDEAG